MYSTLQNQPPSYEQSSGPALRTMGTPEDIAKASTFAGKNSRIYAALRPSPHAISVFAYAQIKMLAMVPCFWPHMICCGPLLFSQAKNVAARLRHTMYIITTDRVIVSVEDHSPPCISCISSGNDSGEIYFENIIEVIVDNTGRGCNSFKVACVKLVLATNQIVLLVDNPSEVAALIRDLRKANKENNQAVVVQPAFPVAAPHNKRIFVASQLAPDEYKIVNLQDGPNGWENFVLDVRKKFGVQHELIMTFKLAALNATVGASEDLGPDDKVIFFTG